MDEIDNQKISKRLFDLQNMLNQFLDIERMIYLPNGKRKDRRETDTEHSFGLAILGWYLCGVFTNLDKNKVIQYALVHDLVEIHAGDVMAVGRTEEQQKLKDKKEAEALEKLQHEWPDFTDMTDMIIAFESQQDEEAIFVKALDKIHPLIHNIMSSGETWKKYDLHRDTIIELKDRTIKSDRINSLWSEIRKMIFDHDEWFNEGKRG